MSQLTKEQMDAVRQLATPDFIHQKAAVTAQSLLGMFAERSAEFTDAADAVLAQMADEKCERGYYLFLALQLMATAHLQAAVGDTEPEIFYSTTIDDRIFAATVHGILIGTMDKAREGQPEEVNMSNIFGEILGLSLANRDTEHKQ